MFRFLVVYFLFQVSFAFILKDENILTNYSVQPSFSFLDFNNELSADTCLCGENGHCVKDNRGRQKCVCYPGYALQGDHKCAECNCGRGGKCIFVKGGISTEGVILYEKKCVCNDGFAEKQGQCIDCMCGNHSTCEFEGEEKFCFCQEGYAEKFKNCERCHCDNAFHCEFLNNDKVCKCNDGFAFVGENCIACECGDHSKGCELDESGGKICFCENGYASKDGSCQKTCDTNGDCHNGGVCTDHKHGHFCDCPKGTAGELCEIVVACKNDPHMCQPGGICSYDRFKEEATCMCEDRSLKYDDFTKTCRNSCNKEDSLDLLDATHNNSCKHRGLCTEQLYGSFCQCYLGTSGDFCEVVDECVGNIPLSCPKDSMCMFDVYEMRASCKCDDDGMEFDRKTWRCKGSCDSHADCHYGMPCEKKFCKCQKGLSGDRCETVDDCKYKFINCKGSEGNCTFFDGKAHCVCAADMAYDMYRKSCKECACGPHSLGCIFLPSTEKNCFCKHGYAEKDGICQETCHDDTLCHNGGICKQRDFGRFCECLSGTKGDRCEIVVTCENEPNKCAPGGICAFDTDKNKATCICADPNLQYDELTGKCRKGCNDAKNSCQNDGICMKQSYGSFCHCFNGTSGDLCQIVDECAENRIKCPTEAPCRYDICLKKARCMCHNSDLEYDDMRKQCRKVCNESMDECQSGSRCIKHAYGSFCRCYDGTRGDRCEVVDECTSNRLTCPTEAPCGYDADIHKVGCLCSKHGTVYEEATQTCKEPCKENSDCRHGTPCKLRKGPYGFCECPRELSGDKCEIIVECERGGRLQNCRGPNGTCVFKNGLVNCECEEGKKFDEVSGHCKDCDCGENSVCNFVQGIKACKCLPKYSILSGKCKECDCGQHSEECLFKKEVKTCLCSKGFKEKDGHCQECDCGKNSASCRFENGLKKCDCFAGYVEENGFCQRQCVDIDCIGGHCEVIGGIEECICPEGLTPVDGECEEVLCRADTCYGGQCKYDKFGKFTCVCPPGFHLEGIGCIETQCKRQNCYGGKCRVIDDHELCTCLEGYTLKDDVCERIPCKEKKCIGGKCDVIQGLERCTCPKGLEIDGDICRASKTNNWKSYRDDNLFYLPVPVS